MKILVFNAGSTSLKVKLFDGQKEIASVSYGNITDHSQALKKSLKEIADLRDITAVGHRFVHGGNFFDQTTKITDQTQDILESINELAPLHNPYSLNIVKEVSEYLTNVPQYAVFDTAFFHDLPDTSRTYALPQKIIDQYGIKKYGFHGISHQYVMTKSCQELNLTEQKINLITCHLGGGASVTAIKQGKPIDTSMGFTPLEGLVMGTRAGDIDPGIIFYLIEKLPGYVTAEKINQVYNILNNDSGLKGLTGHSDFREIIREYSLGNQSTKLAFDIFVNRVIKYISYYFTLLEGKVDSIVFTGAIGSGNPITRNLIMSKLKCLGNIKILSFETDEELMIAREVVKTFSL